MALYLKDEYAVTVADVRPPGQNDGLRFVHCDVRNPKDVDGVLEDASVALYFSIIQIPRINEERRLGYEVNVMGLQNVCDAVLRSPASKGLVLAGTWHVFGERGLNGTIDETFGSRPDMVEERAKLYALSKVVQEGIVRLYDEVAVDTGKVFGVIRMGTVLGAGMPELTAANLFIKKAISGESLTPYRHSMYRPMLYVDIHDICRGYGVYVSKIINHRAEVEGGSLGHIVNLFWPEPITILELAELVRDVFVEETGGRTSPKIRIEDKGIPESFSENAKSMFKVDARKVATFLSMSSMTSPRDSLKSLITHYLSSAA